MMDFSKLSSVTIPEGAVSGILVNDVPVWERILPAGYRRLEYIETTGTQYIKTDFVPDSNSRVVVEFAATRTGIINSIFGSRQSTAGRGFALSVGENNNLSFGYNTYYLVGAFDTARHRADLDRNIFTLDHSRTVVANEVQFTTPHAMFVGGIKASNKIYYSYARFYFCQVYDDGVLVRDLIPCMNTVGEAGMWDRVNRKFYANAGTGAFAGA